MKGLMMMKNGWKSLNVLLRKKNLGSQSTKFEFGFYVGILIAIPSGLLHHILSSASFSIEAPSLHNFSSEGVRECFIPFSHTANQWDCAVHRLKISGNSIFNSVQIVRRFFLP